MNPNDLKKRLPALIAASLMGAVPLALVGCDDGPDDASDVADDIGDALDDAADSVDDAVDDVKDAVDDAGDH